MFAEPGVTPRLRRSVHTEQALDELLSAGPGLPKMVTEILAVEKRGDSLLAFVPLVGPWLIGRSERHTRQEKQWLSALSVGLTLVIFAVFWSLMPRDRLASLRERTRLEMRVLGDVAERYRADHGSYPDEATWNHFAEGTDGRFFDPWDRPYHYEPHGEGLTLKTLGRDGLEGGSGEDADVTVEHLRPPATAARH